MSALPTSALLPVAPSLRLRILLVSCAVVAFSAIWFALAFGRPLANPDEGRYAEIPREIVLLGDWVTPHLNGVAYIEKPPLQYWITAALYKLAGEGEWTARACTLLSAWLDVLLVFLLGRRLWSSRTGVLAAVLLASSVLHFAMGQVLTLDMTFTLLLTAMLSAFCLTQVNRSSAPRESRLWMLTTWLLLGLAVLTKGLAAIVIAAAVLGIYLFWQRDWAMLRTLRPVSGAAVFLVVTAPWFIEVARANPDFLRFFFIHEHFQRYLTDEAQRVEPSWYFLVVLVAGVLPWLPQMAAALWNGWRNDAPRGHFDIRRLLWIWCVFVVVFFSLSDSKLAPYVLPILPPLALLTASRESCLDVRALRISIGILVLLALTLPIYGLIVTHVNTDAIAVDAINGAWPAVAAFDLVAVAIAVWCWRCTQQGRPFRSIVGVAAAWFAGLAMLFATVGHHDGLRSGKSLAAQIPADLAAHAPIFSVQTYDQTLPFYLRRTMFLVDTHGELDYGLQHAAGNAIHDMARFEETWRALPDGIAVMPHRTYEDLRGRGLPMRVLGRDRHRVAVSRR
ncbi:MAG TPA: glycosyltransferase family 39 protein [Steroidobacteraceae bacterium]|nr:glycosyltransferase family 39 protein [Steroidobacteraceae bacterium]